MPRQRLGSLLVLVNAGLLLLAVAGIAVAAARLLRELADVQALARVEQGSITAQLAVDRAGAATAASARLLSERPTLLRLVLDDDTDSAGAFVAQFQETSRLDAVAVLVDGQPFAASGAPLPTADLTAASPAYGFAHLVRTETASPELALYSSAPLPSPAENAFVVVALRLDDAFAQALSAQVGLAVTVVPPAAGAGERVGLHAQVVQTGQRLATHLPAANLYLAVAPLSGPNGEVAGLVEATLPASIVAGSVQQLVSRLLLWAVIVAAAAALGNLLIGRRLSRPLAALTAAAARIGYGDLATPVAPAPGPEMGTLAATLEEMRQRLLDLTAHLRRQQAESAAILTGIVEGVYTVDRERRIRYLNPQAAALFLQPAEAVLDRFCGDVLNPQGLNGRRPCDEQCPILHARFRAGARATEHLRLADGTRRTVVITSAPPGGEAGAAGQLQVQVVRDETEVEATRRLRDAVLANISHEFKTPLAAQLASLELLLDQLPDLTTDQISELLVSLERGALRLTQLIDNLLESVRLDAGEYEIRQRAVALDEVVEQAAEMVRSLLDQRGQSLEIDLPYPCPPICGDAPRLVQVFVNLLANANKFAPPGSRIKLGASVAPKAVTAWVEDQGPGLPVAPGRAIFARYVRAAPDEEGETGGLGLGLWIVKSIVERHGGQVEAQGGAGGVGTRMLVTLPKLEANEDPDCG
ncbi:MAG: HAMP domain-containing protein [Anaerolineales bacterium]|nr:HAMP domain-containing protein [Anaerolineales bacterium]